MAKLTSILTFRGSLEGLTAYNMEGIEKPIVRKKGGPTRAQIHKGANFSLTRKINKETAGRSRAAGMVLSAFGGLRPVVDQSCAGRINAVLKKAQEADTVSRYGQRHVLLSKAPALLEGLALRKVYPLESAIRAPFGCLVNKTALRAQVEIPALLPRINFFPPGSFAFYRLAASLGVVPDLWYDSIADHYLPRPDFESVSAQTAFTTWFPVKSGSPAASLSLQLAGGLDLDQCTLVLAVGVQWGTPGADGRVDVVKNIKSARIEKAV